MPLKLPTKLTSNMAVNWDHISSSIWIANLTIRPVQAEGLWTPQIHHWQMPLGIDHVEAVGFESG